MEAMSSSERVCTREASLQRSPSIKRKKTLSVNVLLIRQFGMSSTRRCVCHQMSCSFREDVRWKVFPVVARRQ